MKKILYLGNTLNQGTARGKDLIKFYLSGAGKLKGSAIGFKLDSLLKLTDTRASNSKMTLMHYLCKYFNVAQVLASKSPALLDFHEDLVSLESASKIQLKSLAEEMQAIIKGLEKVKQEMVASESDGPVSEIFLKTLKEFIGVAETEVASVTNLYSVVGRNADALALYFGEDPTRCPFEQGSSRPTHLNIRVDLSKTYDRHESGPDGTESRTYTNLVDTEIGIYEVHLQLAVVLHSCIAHFIRGYIMRGRLPRRAGADSIKSLMC
ncbi:unnamed protein product [Ilex paraguariensis]|uniref:FH2 domain-containing protein n=1 Tax=Ilex paraguariensis TaxID=185542 RepID=A0ABC8RTH4_9AQUA